MIPDMSYKTSGLFKASNKNDYGFFSIASKIYWEHATQLKFNINYTV